MNQEYRLLIYPASRGLLSREIKEISAKIYDFLSTWKAHGKPLTSSFKIDYSQFILIGVDESLEPASGCSIDALNAFLRTLDQVYNLGIFERMKAVYLRDDQIFVLPLTAFRTQVRAGNLASISVFDFNIASMEEYREKFRLPLEKSWAKNYM